MAAIDKALHEMHAQLLLDSYRRWTGRDLITLEPDRTLRAQLDAAPRIILSHGTETDPVLNYGNKAAMRLWEMNEEQFTSTPSRLTAEPMERKERERFLEQVTANGYVDNYTGIRISRTGKRFYIHRATVWNLVAEDGVYYGQAASFIAFTYTELPGKPDA